MFSLIKRVINNSFNIECKYILHFIRVLYIYNNLLNYLKPLYICMFS